MLGPHAAATALASAPLLQVGGPTRWPVRVGPARVDRGVPQHGEELAQNQGGRRKPARSIAGALIGSGRRGPARGGSGWWAPQDVQAGQQRRRRAPRCRRPRSRRRGSRRATSVRCRPAGPRSGARPDPATAALGLRPGPTRGSCRRSRQPLRHRPGRPRWAQDPAPPPPTESTCPLRGSCRAGSRRPSCGVRPGRPWTDGPGPGSCHPRQAAPRPAPHPCSLRVLSPHPSTRTTAHSRSGGPGVQAQVVAIRSGGFQVVATRPLVFSLVPLAARGWRSRSGSPACWVFRSPQVMDATARPDNLQAHQAILRSAGGAEQSFDQAGPPPSRFVTPATSLHLVAAPPAHGQLQGPLALGLHGLEVGSVRQHPSSRSGNAPAICSGDQSVRRLLAPSAARMTPAFDRSTARSAWAGSRGPHAASIIPNSDVVG